MHNTRDRLRVRKFIVPQFPKVEWNKLVRAKRKARNMSWFNEGSHREMSASRSSELIYTFKAKVNTQ